MSLFDTFLEGLATKGGNLLILCFFTVLTLVFVVHVSYHPVFGPEMRTLAIGTFSGFSGALLSTLTGALKSNSNGGTQK